MAGEGEGDSGADIIGRGQKEALFFSCGQGWKQTGDREQPNNVNNTSSNEGRS